MSLVPYLSEPSASLGILHIPFPLLHPEKSSLVGMTRAPAMEIAQGSGSILSPALQGSFSLRWGQEWEEGLRDLSQPFEVVLAFILFFFTLDLLSPIEFQAVCAVQLGIPFFLWEPVFLSCLLK